MLKCEAMLLFLFSPLVVFCALFLLPVIIGRCGSMYCTVTFFVIPDEAATHKAGTATFLGFAGTAPKLSTRAQQTVLYSSQRDPPRQTYRGQVLHAVVPQLITIFKVLVFREADALLVDRNASQALNFKFKFKDDGVAAQIQFEESVVGHRHQDLHRIRDATKHIVSPLPEQRIPIFK